LSKLAKLWLGIVAIVLIAFVTAALTMPRSFGLTAFCDIAESLFVLSGAASFIQLAKRSRGRLRLFWSLIILGITLWFSYQLMWTCYEVLFRREVPDLFDGDIVLFLNIVPLMAAIALRPHIPRDEYSARLGRLDFALLVVWWFYLYVFVVLPWQYVVANVDVYNRNLNTIYTAEKVAFLAGLIACWIGSRGQWRKFYGRLFAMGFCYAATSAMANLAIERNVYYSGSFYDIPLAAAMASLTWIGLRTNTEEPQADARQVSTGYGVWVARTSMIAVFSLPALAIWALLDTAVPARIRLFRLGLTLLAALLMSVMVFVRQHLLDRELIQLLNRSRESFESLKRLQEQILQSEKLASIGQLVGGAAHELNNPITAMLGYSDLLQSTPLTADQQPLATKIGQNVRRTKSLVASLISFARQGPGPKTAIDLNTLARTAIKLTQPQWQMLNVEVRGDFDPQLSKVLGDSNQLLQVCLQLIGNGLHVMNEQGGKVLKVTTQKQGTVSVLHMATDRLAAGPVPLAGSENDIALSACRGILQEHGGTLSCEPCETGVTEVRIQLPSVEPLPAKAKEANVPVLWQSQPFA
jgi:signal transduction histidine kinase